MTHSNEGKRVLKVLIVGQTPPPYGGQAIMIERLVDSSLAGVEFLHVRMAFSATMTEVGAFRWSKVAHMFAVILRIIYYRIFHRVRILYYPPSGPDRVPMYRDVIILLATRWMFSKTVFHFHAGGISELYDRLPGWMRWLYRGAYFRPDAAVRLAETTPEDAKLLQAVQEYVIPYGVDDPSQGLTVERTPPSALQPLRVLYVGVLRESKGLLVLLEACRRLADRGVKFQLELMGQFQPAEFEPYVRSLIVESKIDQHVTFLGVLTGAEKFAAFARADVFCMPTFFESENFPVVLVEAMALGLPVVATRWRGIPSLVDEGVTGLLVEPHDAEAVSERLEQLAGDVALRTRLGHAGREKFLRDLTLARHLERMRCVFLDIAGDTSASAETASHGDFADDRTTQLMPAESRVSNLREREPDLVM